ncbi:MAG: DnaJ domain-containing protein [Verrucomicrobiales bacterium]|nr:DnaJ domain-containing protein [Verrucomicrobiales bacterium]
MSVEFKDYYEILGVEREAGDDVIRKAYRKLARKYHPDVAEDKVEGERKFKELNEAYEVLSDSGKRKKYDQLGANWDQPGAGYGGAGGQSAWGGGGGAGQDWQFEGTGFSDFFEQMFGAGTGGGARRGGYRQQARSNQPQKGQDVETDLMVTLDEVYHGATRTLRLRKPGAAAGDASAIQTGKVKIPVGVQAGQMLRLKGLGHPGINGGATGDLYLNVRLERHPDFHVKGVDLYYDIELAPWDAVLGTEISVRVPKGKVKLKVPAGSGEGDDLRLGGLGLPTGDGSFGDLHAVIQLKVPNTLNAKEKKAWEKLREVSTFKPGE